MTTNTIGGYAGVLVLTAGSMAGRAVNRRMPPQERKPGPLMPLPYVFHFPGLRRVTALAIGAKIASVNIRMTGTAVLVLLRELEVLVTAYTGNRVVLPGQGETG